MRVVFRLVLIVLVFSGFRAWTQQADPATAVATPDTAAPVTLADAEGPVPVPEPSERAMRYYRTGSGIWLVMQLWALAVPALFLFTGFSAKLRDIARRLGRWWYPALCLYFAMFVVLNYLLDLPLSYQFGFVRQHAYELSNQTFGKWLQDSLIALGFALVIGWMLLWVPYLLIRKSPRRWWLYSGLLLIPLLIAAMLLRPLVFEPLFNTFGPMQDKGLEADILALAERAGIAGSRVFEVDKSVDTKAMNAYVTGFFNTKRIVLWDTIIEKLDREELLFVMGHEMGHYVLNHVLKGILFYSSLGILGLYLVHRLTRYLMRRQQKRFGFHDLSDFASLPLLILCINLVSLVLMPIALAHSRHHEREADRFGIEITQSNRAAATAFVKLQQENLGNPRPGMFYRLWRGSHPSIGERIDFFNAYAPWRSGEPLRYGHYFQPSRPEPEK